MTLFSTPSFLHDYLEQLSRMFSKQPLEKTKEIQLFITIEEDESLYTKNGLYHTTVIELIWFLKIWSDSLNLKFLVPEILFNFADDEISSNTIKSAAARCLVLNRPYIKTIATEKSGKIEYINKVVTE
jgi:hypothetical protein